MDETDAGGLNLAIGNKKAAGQFLRQIAEVQGFGEKFQEGAVAGAASLGREIKKLVMHVKNLAELHSFSRKVIFTALSNSHLS